MTAVPTGRARASTPVNRAKLHRPDLRVEKDLLRSGCGRLAAMDEVGRGALAGPVTVGVVVVTSGIGRVPAGLRDSKLLTPAARARLVRPVRRWAVEWAVGDAGPAEIDACGIMAGLRIAARRALSQLSGPVDAVLLDGNHDYLNPPVQAALFDDGRPPVAVVAPDLGEWSYLPVHLRIKADLRCAGVAAASVLAKTERDALMVAHAESYPAYNWAVNKGYATAEHLAALSEHGPCDQHRRSWRVTGPVDDTLDADADPDASELYPGEQPMGLERPDAADPGGADMRSLIGPAGDSTLDVPLDRDWPAVGDDGIAGGEGQPRREAKGA
jgi:ribonuclease HII